MDEKVQHAETAGTDGMLALPGLDIRFKMHELYKFTRHRIHSPRLHYQLL